MSEHYYRLTMPDGEKFGVTANGLVKPDRILESLSLKNGTVENISAEDFKAEFGNK